ncbi:MAG: arsenite methyltransferase, partial [Planctomycetota bacterium]
GRFSVSDIVVEELPEDLRQHALAYSACIGGAIPEQEYLDGLRAAGFEDVEVVERIVYTKEQLESILSCDFGVEEEALAPIRSALAQVEGKVWSAKVQGRRG